MKVAHKELCTFGSRVSLRNFSSLVALFAYGDEAGLYARQLSKTASVPGERKKGGRMSVQLSIVLRNGERALTQLSIGNELVHVGVLVVFQLGLHRREVHRVLDHIVVVGHLLAVDRV